MYFNEHTLFALTSHGVKLHLLHYDLTHQNVAFLRKQYPGPAVHHLSQPVYDCKTSKTQGKTYHTLNIKSVKHKFVIDLL